MSSSRDLTDVREARDFIDVSEYWDVVADLTDVTLAHKYTNSILTDMGMVQKKPKKK